MSFISLSVEQAKPADVSVIGRLYHQTSLFTLLLLIGLCSTSVGGKNAVQVVTEGTKEQVQLPAYFLGVPTAKCGTIKGDDIIQDGDTIKGTNLYIHSLVVGLFLALLYSI